LSAKIILVGAGGHAKVVLDTLRAAGFEVTGVVDPAFVGATSFWRKLPVLGGDEDLLDLEPNEIELVNGLGSLPGEVLRRQIFQKFKLAGYTFRSFSHPSAIIGSGVDLQEGAQLMAGTIVQADSVIGRNSIVNTGARIDHDCQIGSNVHIAPGAVISGGVCIGDGTHIGTGASVIQGITLGKDVVVGAGTVVVRNVPDNAVVIGAKPRITPGRGME
jgi:UDP-perosamine 4-acetyltransferase